VKRFCPGFCLANLTDAPKKVASGLFQGLLQKDPAIKAIACPGHGGLFTTARTGWRVACCRLMGLSPWFSGRLWLGPMCFEGAMKSGCAFMWRYVLRFPDTGELLAATPGAQRFIFARAE